MEAKGFTLVELMIVMVESSASSDARNRQSYHTALPSRLRAGGTTHQPASFPTRHQAIPSELMWHGLRLHPSGTGSTPTPMNN